MYSLKHYNKPYHMLQMRKTKSLPKVTQLVSDKATIRTQLSDKWNQPHGANKNQEANLKVVKYL